MLAQAAAFLPDDLAGWVVLVAGFAAVLGLGWRAVNKIVDAIDNIAAVPGHTAEIAEVKSKVEDLDDGQLAVLAELRVINEGMVTAAEMTTHTNQDAAQFDKLDRRLTSIDDQLGLVDGRLGRVEDHAGIEHTDPERRR